MYGIQTQVVYKGISGWFENDVKMYGIQTTNWKKEGDNRFENDVKMYGIQTVHSGRNTETCLRMM